MPNETEREVYRALREAQTRYTYFLLAAAGAAIALAVNQTQNRPLSWSQVPLAAAVLSWALSFFFGCRHLGYVASTLFANFELLRVESGRHSQVGEHPQMMAAASDGIRQAIQSNSEHANRLGHWQFRCLVAGGALYVAWHVLEMYVRTVR
jgi:hypothetical protein